MTATAARWPLRSESANSQLLRPSAHGWIWFSTRFFVDRHRPIVQLARQPRPAFQAVVQGFGRTGAARDFLPLRDHPLIQGVGDGLGFFAP